MFLISSQLLLAANYIPPKNGQAGRLEFEQIDIGNNKKFSVTFIARDRNYLRIGQVFQIKNRTQANAGGNPDGRYSTASKKLSASKVMEKSGIVHHLTIRRKTEKANPKQEFYVVEKICSQLASSQQGAARADKMKEQNSAQGEVKAEKMRQRTPKKNQSAMPSGERDHIKQ